MVTAAVLNVDSPRSDEEAAVLAGFAGHLVGWPLGYVPPTFLVITGRSSHPSLPAGFTASCCALVQGREGSGSRWQPGDSGLVLRTQARLPALLLRTQPADMVVCERSPASFRC